MINFFKMRRWGGMFMASFLPTITFFIGNMYYGIMIATAMFFISAIVSILLASKIIENPFTQMLEGSGLLCFDINSTGVIRPFIVGVKQPYVEGRIGGETVHDVYDREAVMQLANPAKEGKALVRNGKVTINFDEDSFNRSRFGLWQYPVLIYNSQVRSLLTKDFLSESEKKSFAEHGVLYLNRKLEELTSTVRDFGRYVVELTKPKGNAFERYKWLWIILIIGLIIIIALFAGPVFKQVSTGIGSAVGAAQGAGPAGPVVVQ